MIAARVNTRPGLRGQELQQLELRRRQAHLGAVDEHLTRVQVDLDAADRRCAGRRAPRGRARRRRMSARTRLDELRERERLGDVVVGAGLEADHDVGLGVARGQQDDRQRTRSARISRQTSRPLSARHHHVEDGEVVPAGARPPAARRRRRRRRARRSHRASRRVGDAAPRGCARRPRAGSGTVTTTPPPPLAGRAPAHGGAAAAPRVMTVPVADVEAAAMVPPIAATNSRRWRGRDRSRPPAGSQSPRQKRSNTCGRCSAAMPCAGVGDARWPRRPRRVAARASRWRRRSGVCLIALPTSPMSTCSSEVRVGPHDARLSASSVRPAPCASGSMSAGDAARQRRRRQPPRCTGRARRCRAAPASAARRSGG